MRPFLSVIASCILFAACEKKESWEASLSPTDLAAISGMETELSRLKNKGLQLELTSDPVQRHQLDSSFHHHDSLHWVHHSNYNHDSNHPHNDHHHEWVPYDSTISHHHHYHPQYPGHPHDSTLVVSTGHHPNHHEHHAGSHHLHHHYVIDSLIRLHHSYH